MPALPATPDLRHLKLQAKSLLRSAQNGDESARMRIVDASSHPVDQPALSDALHTIAAEYGFGSWPQLKVHVEMTDKDFSEKLRAFMDSAWTWGDRAKARTILDSAPEIPLADIHAACAAGDVLAVTDFLSVDARSATKSGGSRGWSPILQATWSCFMPERQESLVKIVSLLLESGADPDSYWTNESGIKETALYGAVEQNCVQVARVLVDAGANPNDDESLYHACEKFNLDLLDVLAINGLDSDTLSYCVKHVMDFMWDDGIRWFLDHGADPNVLHPAANETSLHWAVKRGCSLRAVQWLLEAGADPNARTMDRRSAFIGLIGWTPLDFALRLGLKTTANLLLLHGAVPTEQSDYDRYVIACANGDREAAIKLGRTNTGGVAEEDGALIAHVAQMQSWSGVRLMVERGWNVEAVGWMGATPLYWALCFGDPDTVSFLLQNGASTNPVGGYFQHPLHTVVHCHWDREGSDYEGALLCLLEHGLAIPDGFYPCGHASMDAILSRYMEKYPEPH
ncbi:MAG: hypothetical protein HOH43_06395 [Candidatus Latescibacteria bacterium]|nr:hypothetical protein [Candidatus Latescibacterota bacterium]